MNTTANQETVQAAISFSITETGAGIITITKDTDAVSIVEAYNLWFSKQRCASDVFALMYDASTDTLDCGEWTLVMSDGVAIDSNVSAYLVRQPSHTNVGELSNWPSLALTETIAVKAQTQDQDMTALNQQSASKSFAGEDKLNRLIKEGVGSRVPKKQKTRPTIAATEAASNYLAAAIKDFRLTGVDGVDFINTSASAETRLGRALDINAHIPFQYQNVGVFASVGAFWYFISAEQPDDSLRGLYGTAARNARNRVQSRPIDGFRTLIADATWAKINSDPKLKEAFILNDLPYVCFYRQENTPLITQAPVTNWYMPALEEIAYALRESIVSGEQVLPDFGFLERQQPRGRGRRR